METRIRSPLQRDGPSKINESSTLHSVLVAWTFEAAPQEHD